MRFFDRSRQAALFSCPRKRFLGYEYRGIGLEPRAKPYFFATGTLLHETIQDLLMGTSLDVAIATSRAKAQALYNEHVTFETDAPISIARIEQADLTEALARAFAKHRLNTILEEYDVLGVEVPITFVLNDIVRTIQVSSSHMAMFRLDAILRRRSDSGLFVWELKSTSTASPSWLNGWDFNIQLMAETLALTVWAKANGYREEDVKGVILEGLVKGSRRKGAEGLVRQNSPLIYANYRPGNGLTTGVDISHTWKRGYEKRLVSSIDELGAPDERIRSWIAQLPDHVLMEQLIALPVIPRSTDREQAWVRQTLSMEHRVLEWTDDPRIETGKWETLDYSWPQNTKECGFCEFQKICHEPSVRNNIMASGLYQKRIPNHELERDYYRTRDS